MDVGMLWFDNDEKIDLFSKVNRAAKYYQEKYGKQPNVCYVHPSMIEEIRNGSAKKIKAGDIEVRTTITMLPNHFWIGVNGKEEVTA